MDAFLNIDDSHTPGVNGFNSERGTFYVHSFVIMCGHVKPIRDAVTECNITKHHPMAFMFKAFKAAMMESINPFRTGDNNTPINIDWLLSAGGYPPQQSCPFDVSYLCSVC